MSAQLKLTQAELDLIEANRAAEEAREAAAEAQRVQRAAEQKQKEIERASAREAQERKDNARKLELVNALRAADTNGVFTYTDTVSGVPNVTFMIGATEERVCINEIVDKSSWRYRNTGAFQYTISGGFNEYRHRNFKNPKTLIARVVEFQEIARCQAKAKEERSTLAQTTVAHLEERYPNADVKQYGASEWAEHCSKYSTTYHVKTAKGLVVFTSSLRDGELTLARYKVVLSDAMIDAAQEEILRG